MKKRITAICSFCMVLTFLLFSLVPMRQKESSSPDKYHIVSANITSLDSLRVKELLCGCDGEKYFLVQSDQVPSICSARATSRGKGQRVASYSLFGQNGERAKVIYEEYLTDLFPNVKEKYPGETSYYKLFIRFDIHFCYIA